MGSIGATGASGPRIVSGEEFAQQDYDYLILGGGTAGLVIAARLSENPEVTVGVIEAGKNKLDDMLVNTPAMFLQMLGNDDYDWKYMTTPQVGSHGATPHHMARGKMLGGSSGINYMAYVRGSDKDFDDWAYITGDEGWSAKNVKQYFRKHQTLEPISEAVTDRSAMPFVGEHHGTSGEIHTSFNELKLDLEDDFVKSADKVIGYEKKPLDPWSGDHNGVYQGLATIGRTGAGKGRRSYAANGYLREGRSNLIITTESFVTRVDLDGDRAIGATFKNAGQQRSVKAQREVIVCGGSVASPQILELSGIGDPVVLQKAGIECKIENKAVGENLQDHVLHCMVNQTKEGIDTMDALARPEILQEAIQKYQDAAAGPLTCTSTVTGFFPFKKFVTEEELEATISSIEKIENQTDYARRQRETIIAHLRDEKSANLQILLVCATANPIGSQQDQTKLWPPVALGEPNGITPACGLQYPVSRGSVHVHSADPAEQPDINPAYLTHTADLDVLAVGVKRLAQITDTEPLKSKLGKRLFPRPELDLNVIEDCKTAILDWYISECHPCGSVAMGDALDSRLKVKGVKGLRVADASVFPGNVSGNIVSTVYMVGERAADLIREDWDYANLKSVA